MPIEITEIRWVLTAKVLVFQCQVVVMLKRPAPWVLALHQNFSIHNELYRPYLRRIRLGVGGYADIRWIYIYIYGMGASLSYFLHTFESHDSQLLKFCDSTVSSCDTLMPFPVRFVGVGLVGELVIAGLGWCHTTPVTLMIP